MLRPDPQNGQGSGQVNDRDTTLIANVILIRFELLFGPDRSMNLGTSNRLPSNVDDLDQHRPFRADPLLRSDLGLQGNLRFGWLGWRRHLRRRGLGRRQSRIDRQKCHRPHADGQEHRPRHPSRWQRRLGLRNSQYPPQTGQQHAPRRRRREYRRSGPRDGRQGLYIDRAVGHQLDCHIIAAMLTLRSHPCRNPPDGRVVKQQGLNDTLHQIQQIVLPHNVRELMRQQSFQLITRQLSHQTAGQQNDRL